MLALNDDPLPLSMSEKNDLSWDVFSASLRELNQKKYVQLSTKDSKEVHALTPKGRGLFDFGSDERDLI